MKKAVRVKKETPFAVAWGRWMTRLSHETGITDVGRLETMREGYLASLDAYLEMGEPHQLERMLGPLGSECPLCHLPYPANGPKWYPCSAWRGIPAVAAELAAGLSRLDDIARGKKERALRARASALGMDPDELREPVKGSLPLAFASMGDSDE
jgi:hypothetical protein